MTCGVRVLVGAAEFGEGGQCVPRPRHSPKSERGVRSVLYSCRRTACVQTALHPILNNQECPELVRCDVIILSGRETIRILPTPHCHCHCHFAGAQSATSPRSPRGAGTDEEAPECVVGLQCSSRKISFQKQNEAVVCDERFVNPSFSLTDRRSLGNCEPLRRGHHTIMTTVNKPPLG